MIMFFSFFPFNIVNYIDLGMLNWSYVYLWRIHFDIWQN